MTTDDDDTRQRLAAALGKMLGATGMAGAVLLTVTSEARMFTVVAMPDYEDRDPTMERDIALTMLRAAVESIEKDGLHTRRRS